MPDKPLVHIYTDGACSPNPGVGGWAAILIAPNKAGKELVISGAVGESTNNRMELMAAIEALKRLKRPSLVHLFTDSEYLRNAFTKRWIDGWQRNGWRTAAKKPVANEDLWRELIQLAAPHEVHWKWVRGHADDPLNSRCDELAVEARQRLARAGRA